jgi:hypothetical protein
MIPAPGANAVVKQVFRARYLVARLPKQLRQPREVDGDLSRLALRSWGDGTMIGIMITAW